MPRRRVEERAGGVFVFVLSGVWSVDQIKKTFIGIAPNSVVELAYAGYRVISASASRWNCSGQEPAGRERKKMKKSLIAIAFAVATMPMIFAAQNKPAANPPANSASSTTGQTATTATPKVKKHVKKHKKSAVKGATANTPAAKPAAAPSK